MISDSSGSTPSLSLQRSSAEKPSCNLAPIAQGPNEALQRTGHTNEGLPSFQRSSPREPAAELGRSVSQISLGILPMSISSFIVDWPKFVSEWKTRPDYASVNGFYWDAMEEPKPWIAHHRLWTDSPTTQMHASEVYEELRPHLDKASRRAFDKLFGAFFWWNEAAGKFAIAFHNDLGKGANPEVFAITMKPATVEKHLALWDEGAFDRLRAPFKAEFPEGNERIENFGVFKKYVKMWVSLLQKAASKHRGVVVSVHGT
jgi:hypothetical protein